MSNFMEAPPDAPREVSQPLKPELIQQQTDLARERDGKDKFADVQELADDFFDPVPTPAAPEPPAPVIEMPAARAPEPADLPASSAASSDEPAPAAPAPRVQPAASDTDTPARGQPRAISDPGKVITGGFGAAPASDEYFPLDGTELRAVVLKMLEQMQKQIQDDLRFSAAVTYPQFEVDLKLTVTGHANQQTFVIPYFHTHDQTPIEVAEQHADEVAFVTRVRKREQSPEGESEAPPNAMRMEAGLQLPRKQAIQTPQGRTWVDVKADRP